METYIVRIRRSQEEESPIPVGIVEDAGSGRKTKFCGSVELLKILKLERDRRCGSGKSKQRRTLMGKEV